MTATDLTRRRLLQATGAAGIAALLPAWLAEAAAAATPVGPGDGILVLLTLDGGNDGLNTFVPISDGAYHDARRHLAIRPEHTLPLTASRGLHPELGYLKALWDQGLVAVVDGVGQPAADLSHFFSMDRMMTAQDDGLPGATGWLGRILDGLNRQPLNGLSIGSRVPLLLEGHAVRGNSVPIDGGAIRSVNHNDWAAGPRLTALTARAGAPTGLGSLADESTAVLADAIGIATDLQPHLLAEAQEPDLVRKLRLAAQLVNANVGVRVLSITYGDFDTHANQLTRHGALMNELDQALRVFFSTLDLGYADQVLLLGTSEFGRRVRANANGTDHGTANSLFAIGTRVNAGFHGQAPSLTSLDPWGNQHHHVDYRQVYANVATTWLGADAAQILGSNHADLGFLRPPRRGASSPSRFPGVAVTRRELQGQVARLYIAYFGRIPDEAGLDYWVRVRETGRTLAQTSAEFAGSDEFRRRYGALSSRQFVDLAYRNVLGREGDPGGLDHWTAAIERGGGRGDVMVGFSESEEFRVATAGAIAQMEQGGPVARLYRAYFGRPPDDAGLAYWTNTRLDRDQISQHFAASAEFQSRYGNLDDPQFVELVFGNVLGRHPDPAGLDYWAGELRAGVSRGRVMLAFSDSPEFINRLGSA